MTQACLFRLILIGEAAFAGALMQIIQTQPEPQPLCIVVLQSTRPLIQSHSSPSGINEPNADAGAADGPLPGTTSAKRQRSVEAVQAGMRSSIGEIPQSNSTGAALGPREAAAQQLSTVARPLTALADFAAEVLATPAGRLHKAGAQDRPRKRRRKSDSGAPVLPPRCPLHPWIAIAGPRARDDTVAFTCAKARILVSGPSCSVTARFCRSSSNKMRLAPAESQGLPMVTGREMDTDDTVGGLAALEGLTPSKPERPVGLAILNMMRRAHSRQPSSTNHLAKHWMAL